MATNNQLKLFKGSGPTTFDVNSINGTKEMVPDNRPRLSAGAALKLRVVDDRVFSVGITTWKALIDLAFNTGHVELFESEDNRVGLRKPGYLYAPLPRLPERAAEYVKTRQLAKGADLYLAKRANPRKISFSLTDGRSLEISINSEAMTLRSIVSPGDEVCWELKYCAFPFTDGDDDEDLKRARCSISARLRNSLKEAGALCHYSNSDLAEIAQAMHETAQMLRSLPL